MKQNKGKSTIFEFDYDNYILKSSQQQFLELEKEVINKLNNIENEVNIAGKSKKEKRHNLLMHYKSKLGGFEFEKDRNNINVTILTIYVSSLITVFTFLIPYAKEYMNISIIDSTKDWINVIVIMVIFMIAIAIIFMVLSKLQDDSTTKIKKKYMYYKFYYEQLKKYVKKD